ncbi:MAG: LysR family transcriptional regulator [Bryobacteraceae bacterium]
MLDSIKLFRDIAQAKSVSKGAAENGISQSAASQHLQELERKLGVKLLNRTTRPVTPTEAGKLYLDFCRDVLRRQDQFLADLDRLKPRVEGLVRVASIYSIGLSEMSRLREAFTERFPHVRLQVDYMRPDRIYEAVLGDKADMGLVSYPVATKELAVIPWREEEMAVAAAPNHPLAQTAVLVPSDLAAHDFVGFDEELTIRRELDRFFRGHDVEIRMAMQFDNIQMVKEAVALGSGVSILPARTFQADVEQGRLVSIPLLAPGLVRPLGIVHRRKKKFNRATQCFLELLQETPDADKAGFYSTR